jgi:hypothetical protein
MDTSQATKPSMAWSRQTKQVASPGSLRRWDAIAKNA